MKTYDLFRFTAGAGLLLMAGCAADTETRNTSSAPEYGEWGFDAEGMDASLTPGDDFYRYANGTWLANTEIPAALSDYGMFRKLSGKASDAIAAMVRELSSETHKPGSHEQLIGDFYASWMNIEEVERLGMAPAKPYIDMIDNVVSLDDLAGLFASAPFISPYALSVSADPNAPETHTLVLAQGALFLPGRTYYLEDQPQYAAARDAYVDYTSALLDLLGAENAAERATQVLQLETALAEVHWSEADSRNIELIMNRYSIEDAAALAPGLNLETALSDNGAAGQDSIIVMQPSAIEGLSKLLAETPLSVWKDYLTVGFLHHHAEYLPRDFSSVRFELFDRIINGTAEETPRHDRGVSLLTRYLGDSIGQLYANRTFSEEKKQQVLSLVGEIRDAHRQRLMALDWMKPETKTAAIEKLDAIGFQVGYPDKPATPPEASVAPGTLFDNVMALEANAQEQNFSLLGQPVDQDAWPYPPQIAGASYSASANRITLPAGILQAPFFDANADDAMNYGGIGVLIGHELSHAFDMRGRSFDAQGELRDWWDPETDREFRERTVRLIEQYDAYEPIAGHHVNGRFTLNENLADLGGLLAAMDAYRAHLAECCDGQAQVLSAFTGEQRFYLSFAQTRRQLYREENLILRMNSVAHSPAEYRVNGSMRNIGDWYAAFDVSADNALYIAPEERVDIW